MRTALDRLAYAAVWVGWAVISIWWQASYVVRPYDITADRRRWFWQPRTPCGFSNLGR